MELEISPGEKIQIIRSDNEINYTGRIIEVLPEGVLVEFTKVNPEYVDLRIGETINIVYNIDDSVYSVKSEVTSAKKKPKLMMSLKFTGIPEKIQRRSFVRLRVNIPVSFRIIYDERKMSTEYKATTCDISGNGVRLSSEIRFIPGMLLLIRIDLKEYGQIKVKGRVISTYEPNTTAANTLLNEAGIKFESIDSKTQDSIMMYIFYKLRKLRQKGLS